MARPVVNPSNCPPGSGRFIERDIRVTVPTVEPVRPQFNDKVLEDTADRLLLFLQSMPNQHDQVGEHKNPRHTDHDRWTRRGVQVERQRQSSHG